MDTDPDPAKLGHRIHNTAKKYIILSIFPGGPVAKAGAFWRSSSALASQPRH